ncbi:MAG: DUF4175 domain-containing protein [Acetobacteraceae bacterium]
MKATSDPSRAKDAASRFSATLERRRLFARLGLIFEQSWRLLAPPLGLVGLFVAAALFGFIALLSPWLHLAVLAALSIALAFVLAAAVRRFRLPSRAAADRRLEQTNGLTHRPLAALADRPATRNPTALLLWQMHRERMAARLANLRVGLPHPNLAAVDRFALRAGLLVALIASFGVAGPAWHSRLAAAFTPTIPAGPAPPPFQLDAWITPPVYTHLPPVFLKVTGGSFAVPKGSALAVSATGGSGTPRLELAGRDVPFRALGPASFRAEATVTQGGRLQLRRGLAEIAAWDLSVIAPTAPIVQFAAPPGPDAHSTETRFPWHIQDTYGVAQLAAELHLQVRPAGNALGVPLPLAGTDTTNATGTALIDLTASPWAGLDVTAQLKAVNGAGLLGRSDTLRFRLPEIAFHNPLARALIAVRKHLALAPRDRQSAIAGLDRLASTPAAESADLGGFLNMRAIAALLHFDHDATAIDRAEQRLWELAWHYEAGPTARTSRELAAAIRALEQALAEAGQPNGPNQAEINRRITALEQAIQHQIEALAKTLPKHAAKLPNITAAKRYDQRTFERMAQAIRQAVQAGDLPTARSEMAQLQRLLQALQHARPIRPEDLARAQQMQKGEQAMGALGDVLRREGTLFNHAEGRLARPQSPAARAERSSDQAMQQALRRALGVLMSDLADATGKVPSALGKADIAMGSAATALGKGADAPAAKAEQQAIADLQQGGRQAMAAMNGKGGQGGMQPGLGVAGFLMPGGATPGNPLAGQFGRVPGVGLDPFGRPLGDQADGGRANGFVRIPDNDVAAEARAIEEELRHRDANPSLPAPDRSYIQRLLKEF